ncbi:unnamed protein product [Effrenium voratum]|nr:unnamed protein product [Effrenium voratum]
MALRSFCLILLQAVAEESVYTDMHVYDAAVSILQVYVDLEQTNSTLPTAAWFAQYEGLTRHFANPAVLFDRLGFGEQSPAKKAASSFALKMGNQISKVIVCIVLAALGITVALLLSLGLPQKQPRQVNHTLPRGVFPLLVMMVGMVYCSTEIYVPSLPQMELDLGGDQSLMSGTVQVNLLMKAVGCFVIAPLSDRVGRRPCVLACLSLAFLTSVACMLTSDIIWCLTARALQGLSEAVECLCFAIIRDWCDDADERFRVYAALWIATIFFNMASPLLGGMLAIFSSWRVAFLLLAISWGSLLNLAYVILPESAPAQSGVFLEDLAVVTADWRQNCLIIAAGLCYSCYHSFLANVSYVLEEGHGKGLPATCVVIAGVMAFMYVVTQVQSYFLDGSVMEVARCAMLCTLPAVLLDFVAAGLSVRSLWGYLVPTAIHVSLIAMPVMSLPTLYMQPLEKVAGLAASMEVVTAGVLSSVCSVLSTEALIYAGQARGRRPSYNTARRERRSREAGIVLFQGAVTFSAVLIFWLGQGIWSRGQRCT